MSEQNERVIINSDIPQKTVAVLLPVVLRGVFDYKVPDGMQLQPGDYVLAPFGGRSLWGVVWGEAVGDVAPEKIKSIELKATHIPPMSATMRSFIDWVAWYTLSPQGMTLRMALSAPDAFSWLKPTPPAPVFSAPAESHTLNPAQAKAADFLHKQLGAGYGVTLIDGVTGSGKTEVYFDLITHCLTAGKQALVLLPEITLSVQWLQRFEKHFGFTPHVWHSGVTPARRRNSWTDVADGKAQVVVGARSALFLPFKNLGVIIVDEEHDASYKQEDGVIYHARDMAVARAKHEQIPAVLVSATPSLETEQNMLAGRYHAVHLPHRHGVAQLPAIHMIDMRQEPMDRQSWLSPSLQRELLKNLAEKKQSLLFLNRRGYAPLMLCRTCGHRMQCPHCATSLTLHKSHKKLLCHHCGHTLTVPKNCPDCKAEDAMTACGPGVERIAEETRILLPQARIEIMTSDLIDTPAKAEVLVQGMIDGTIDILIGTQMIAKGHHFANLTLVGVVDADMGLNGGDLRASERTYQLLHQLSGRAGREASAGQVWLQTYQPEHPVMKAIAAGDRASFMEREAAMREECAMPPFGKLAAIIVEGTQEREVAEFARNLVREAATYIQNPDVLVLGPAPAPLSLLRGKYRYRLLIKAPRNCALQKILQAWLLRTKPPASLRIKIDIDPYSFM